MTRWAMAAFVFAAGFAGWAVLEATRSVAPEFDGPPLFLPAGGTPAQYAINTESTLLRVRDEYYLYRDGVWYTSSSAAGPYSKVGILPDELREPAVTDR